VGSWLGKVFFGILLCVFQANVDRLRGQLMEVVSENRTLHAELKRNVVDDIVRTTGVPLASTQMPAVSTPSQPPTVSRFSQQKLQTELVIIHNCLLYTGWLGQEK